MHPKTARIVVCEKTFDYADEAEGAIFSDKLLHHSNYYKKSAFGGINPRHASPLIAQPRLVDQKICIVLTAMRSNLPDRDWVMLNEFLDDCQRELGGQTVWGGLS